MKTSDALRQTASVCPICLQRIPARLQRREGGVYLEKTCPTHGNFSCIVWRDRVLFEEWTAREKPLAPSPEDACPTACGLCAGHGRKTCCALLEVTSRCSLACPDCFARNKINGEPSFEELAARLQELGGDNGPLVQLSGGEPTDREDLLDLIRAGKAAGVRYLQLNTNGIRIGAEPDYARKLADAGLSFVFMQFDGLTDGVYRTLRGQNLLDVKLRAIARLGEAGLGVTLVPMLVPGVNTHEIGDLLRFAIQNSPAVRGVHFQPASYFHRAAAVDDAARYTLDQLILDIETQTNGLVPREHLLPSCCDHARCGFHADYMVAPDGLLQLKKKGEAACCGGDDAHVKNRRFVARRWERPQGVTAPQSIRAMGDFLARVKTHGFTVTAMAFMDAMTLDLERLKKCSLHVYEGNGRFVPFCAHYIFGARE